MRFFLHRICVVVCVLSVGGLMPCGCVGKNAKRGEVKGKQPAPPSPGAASPNPSAWQTRLGRIVLVNSSLDFVLIDAGTAPVPEPGTRLCAYTGEELSGELSVSIHQQRPFLIADIVSGKPRVSDMVVPVKNETQQGTGRPPAGALRQAESPRPAQAALPASRPPVSEIPDTQELPQIERRPPPPAQSLLSPSRPAIDESEAIIPGLPSSGKNPPR
jgi:hypothetical protein